MAARLHIKHQTADFHKFGDRFGAQWTPTVLVIDPDGVERHRIEGFIPADEMAAQLLLGLGHVAFYAKQYADAGRRFREVLTAYPDSEAAPEAQYWAGVSSYKATKNADALAETARAFEQRYQGSIWAKKSAVWKSDSPTAKAG